MAELMNMYVLLHIFLILLAVYTFFKLGKDLFTVRERRLFKNIILSFCIYVVTAGVWSLMENGYFRYNKWVFVLNSSLSYLVLLGIAYFLYSFVMTRYSLADKWGKVYRITAFIPSVIVVVLLIVSAFTGVLFSIETDAEGVSHVVNGPLYIVMIISALSYFVAIFVLSIINAIKTPSVLKRKEYYWLSFAMILIVCCVLGGAAFAHLTILPMAIFAAIYITFTNLQESGINNDALTGLNNNRRANEYLRERLLNVTETQPLVLYLCDVNYFKQINDKWGHLEGDKALILVADTLSHIVSDYSGFVARYGGDEFIFSIDPSKVKMDDYSPSVIKYKISEELTRRCEEENKPYKLTASIGYTACTNPRKPLSFYFGEADEMLYKVKREYHEKFGKPQ